MKRIVFAQSPPLNTWFQTCIICAHWQCISSIYALAICWRVIVKYGLVKGNTEMTAQLLCESCLGTSHRHGWGGRWITNRTPKLHMSSTSHFSNWTMTKRLYTSSQSWRTWESVIELETRSHYFDTSLDINP